MAGAKGREVCCYNLHRRSALRNVAYDVHTQSVYWAGIAQKLSMLHRLKVLKQSDARRRHLLRTHDPQSRGRRSRGLHAIIDSGRRSAETCSRRELHLRRRKSPLLERNDNRKRDHQQTRLWRPLQSLRQESSLHP